MKYHIVQINEKINDISRKYNVSVEEIVKLNRHVNNIENVIPGMKLRIPILTDEVSDQLKESFLDIEKYYPKLDEFKEVQVEKKEIPNYNEQNMDYGEQVKKEEKPGQLAPMNPPAYMNQTQQYYQPYQYYQQAQPTYPQQSYPMYQNYNQNPYPQQQPIYPQPYPYNMQMAPNFGQRDIEDTCNKAKEIPIIIEEKKEKVEIKMDQNKDLFNKPAYCDPNLLVDKTQYPYYQPDPCFFQQALYNPPYPCQKIEDYVSNQPVSKCDFKVDCVREDKFSDKVKEIKVDLRDFIKKNTKITKKKDDFNLL